LARNWNPKEKTERPPIAEILQIFAWWSWRTSIFYWVN
jgi:hypothetical protein